MPRSATINWMPHQLPPTDFRALRFVFGSDDFSREDPDPDPSPHDQISETTWHRLMTQPSDVSIKTSEYHGSLLTVQDELRAAWWDAHLAIVHEPTDPVLYAMQDVAGEFHAAIFDALHGFYRQSISSLRSCIELMLEGCAKALNPLQRAQLSAGFSFTRETDFIRKATPMRLLDDQLEALSGQRLFGAATQPPGSGWVGDLYGRLSEYTHARPGRTLVDTWEHSGPVYVYSMAREFHFFFVEVFCASCVLAGVGRPSIVLPANVAKIIKRSRVQPGALASVALRALYPTVFDEVRVDRS